VFSFDTLYLEIVTQIKTTEILAEFILFDSVQSFNETKEFSKSDYWAQESAASRVDKYWFFAQNGQGYL
jgi:hypothetical protein